MTGHGLDDLSAAGRPGHAGTSGSSDGSDEPSDARPFRSAEEWLAERGIERNPIRVRPPGPDDASKGGAAQPTDRADATDGGAAAPTDRADATGGGRPRGGPHDGDPGVTGPASPSGHGPDPSTREVAQLATEAPAAVPGEGHVAPGADGQAPPPPDGSREPGPLMDEVSRALAFIQRSTATTPASTGRLRRKLGDRDVPAAAIGLALEEAAAQGLVDDAALAAALVAEGREKGHAPRRLRADLRTREFPDQVIDTALGEIRDRDPEAAAFDVARRKARSYRTLDAETSFRRLVGYLARRGHNEHMARKVARQVVFDDREDDRVTGH